MKLTEARQKFIYRHCGSRGRVWIARRLGVSPSTVSKYVAQMGRQMGVRVGYVKLADAMDAAASRTASYAARADGVLYQADYGRAPYTVPERWLDEYLDRQIEWSVAGDTAAAEGWWTVHDIARVVGLPWRTVSSKLTPRKANEGFGRCFKDVPRLRGPRRQVFYEPAAAAAAATEARRYETVKAGRRGYAEAALEVMRPGEAVSISDEGLLRRIAEASGREYRPTMKRGLICGLERTGLFDKEGGGKSLRVLRLREWRAKAA